MAAKFPLTQAEFKAWRKKHPKPRISEPRSKTCPLARALKEKLGMPVIVGKSAWLARTGPHEWALTDPSPLPKWALDFVRRFDAGEAV